MKDPKPLRIWFAAMAAILWLGICFTGFSEVNWLLYLPAIGLIVAGIFGFCPSLVLINKIFGTRYKNVS